MTDVPKEMCCFMWRSLNRQRELCASSALQPFLIYEDYFLNLQHIPHLEPRTPLSWPFSWIAAIWQTCTSGKLELSNTTLYVQSTVWTDGLLGIHISLHLKGATLRFSGTVVNKRIFFIYIYVCIYIFIYFIHKCSKCPLGVHLFLSFQMMTKYLICSISPEKILVREWQFWCTLEWHNHVNACTIKTYELIQSF